MTEHTTHVLVFPRRHLFEVLEESFDVFQRGIRAAQKAERTREIACLDEPRRLLDLVPRVLQPELRRLVHGLEEQLVAMHPFVGALLQRE